MNPERVQQEISKTNLMARWRNTYKHMEEAWDANKEALFALTLDEDEDAGLVALEDMPAHLKAFQAETMKYRRGIMDIAFVTGA